MIKQQNKKGAIHLVAIVIIFLILAFMFGWLKLGGIFSITSIPIIEEFEWDNIQWELRAGSPLDNPCGTNSFSHDTSLKGKIITEEIPRCSFSGTKMSLKSKNLNLDLKKVESIEIIYTGSVSVSQSTGEAMFFMDIGGAIYNIHAGGNTAILDGDLKITRHEDKWRVKSDKSDSLIDLDEEKIHEIGFGWMAEGGSPPAEVSFTILDIKIVQSTTPIIDDEIEEPTIIIIDEDTGEEIEVPASQVLEEGFFDKIINWISDLLNSILGWFKK